MTNKNKARAKPVTLKSWQVDRGITDTEAAAVFGLARNSFVKYRDGKPPLIVKLALAAVVNGLSA